MNGRFGNSEGDRQGSATVRAHTPEIDPDPPGAWVPYGGDISVRISRGISVKIGKGVFGMGEKIELMTRLRREGRWEQAVPVRDELMRGCRKQGMSKEAAQAYTYGELDRLFPALPETETKPSLGNSEPAGEATQGLKDVPTTWGTLPANASLQAEVAWVQSQRLLVVEETPSGSARVRLDRATEPAPSMSALSWLETSVRSYAKFIDVAGRVLAGQADEQAQERREQMQIEEIKQILAEMLDV